MPRRILATISWVRASLAGWNPPAANVAVEPFELVAAHHAAAAGDVECDVDDALGRLDGSPLGRDDLQAPHRSVVDAGSPVVDQAVHEGRAASSSRYISAIWCCTIGLWA